MILSTAAWFFCFVFSIHGPPGVDSVLYIKGSCKEIMMLHIYKEEINYNIFFTVIFKIQRLSRWWISTGPTHTQLDSTSPSCRSPSRYPSLSHSSQRQRSWKMDTIPTSTLDPDSSSTTLLRTPTWVEAERSGRASGGGVVMCRWPRHHCLNPSQEAVRPRADHTQQHLIWLALVQSNDS